MEAEIVHNENKIFSPKNMSKLEHPDRYKELPPVEVLRYLDLQEGHRFGDFGCGIGFFSIPAAEIVGKSGHVYASDISQEMLDGLMVRMPEGLKERVTLCLAGVTDSNSVTGIQNASIERAMISTVLHEVDDPEQFLSEVSKTLVSSGKLAVIEWIKEDMPHGPKQAIRISESELEVMLEKTGYILERTIHLSKRFYLAIAKKL